MKRHAAYPASGTGMSQLTVEQAKSLTRENVTQVKMLDCSMYSACLTEAAIQDWPNFGCTSCAMYQALDTEQRVQDVLGLHAMLQAAENYQEMGHAGRIRGVRPGADAKVRSRKLRVLTDDDMPEAEEPEAA